MSECSEILRSEVEIGVKFVGLVRVWLLDLSAVIFHASCGLGAGVLTMFKSGTGWSPFAVTCVG